MKSDEFKSIASEQTTETKVKGSRFIGETFLVSSVDQAQAKLKEVRQREHAATHHCYAYITGLPTDLSFKYSDDGEPNGTAGKPIYDQIAGRELTDTLVVVTRYFGGTKLGTGGLTRAYSGAAQLALEKSGIRTHFISSIFETVIEFPYYDQWQRLLDKLGARVLESQFEDQVRMKIEIRQTLAEKLVAQFIELTSGKGSIKHV